MKRFVVALSAFSLLAGLSVACSTHSSPAVGSASGTGAAKHAASNPTGHLGDTLDLTRADGTKIAVTLTQIINPATLADGLGERDKTYMATQLKIKNSGTSTIESDVNVNVSVVGSDDHSYTADLGNVTECTNFDSGVYHLDGGQSTIGCVVFALPHGVTPAKVKYTPSEGFADDFGEWQLH